MKILFSGPSLYATEWAGRLGEFRGIDCRGPACQGDLTRAVVEGATAIGLVDGCFEDSAAVWHKEILYALEEGVHVLGAASMGALRAAECAAFGMVGIGGVFERYRSGDLEDDAAVAQIHAPAEMDYAPLTEALVNVEATFLHLSQRGLITQAEAAGLEASARSLFFKERTYRAIIAQAGVESAERRDELRDLISRFRVNVKQEDALQLVRCLAHLALDRQRTPEGWRLHQTETWQLTLERARGGAGAVSAA